MFTLRTVVPVSLVLAAGLVAGCSADEPSAAASAGAAKQAMSAPATSDLTKSNGAKAYSSSQAQQGAGGFSPFGGGGGTGAVTQGLAIRSVHILAGDDPTETCEDVNANKNEGSCPCDGGGSIAYVVSDLAALKAGRLDGELSMSFVLEGCALEGKKLDGKMTIIQSSKPIIDKSKWSGEGGTAATPGANTPGANTPGANTPGGLNMLWSAEKLSDGTDTHDFALLVQDGETCLRPAVDSGFYYVCIGGGGVAIHAKNGSFRCDFDKLECSGDGAVAEIALDSAPEQGTKK